MSGVTAPAFQVVISLKLIVDAKFKFKIFYHYLISCQESFSLVGLESSKNVYFVTILNSKCPGKVGHWWRPDWKFNFSTSKFRNARKKISNVLVEIWIFRLIFVEKFIYIMKTRPRILLIKRNEAPNQQQLLWLCKLSSLSPFWLKTTSMGNVFVTFLDGWK